MEDLTDLLTVKVAETPALWVDGKTLGDNPETHRWRAWWEYTSWQGNSQSIQLRPYKVLSTTPCGAWIDPLSYGQDVPSGWEWVDIGSESRRWVSNQGAQAWAKPTQEEALHSLAVRLTRWSKRLRRDVERVLSAANTLALVMPERKQWAEVAAARFPEFPTPEALK